MDEVKKAVASGVSFAGAMKDKLGMSTGQFAKKYKLSRTQLSAMINGRMVPDDKQLTALVAHFGGSKQEWLDLWFKVAQRQSRTAV